jgi:hypothetical protein
MTIQIIYNFWWNIFRYTEYRLDYGLDNRRIEIRFLQRREIFLFSTASRLALGTTQPPVQRVPGPLSLELVERGLKLSTVLHPVSRLRIRGALLPFPTCLHIMVLNGIQEELSCKWGVHGAYESQWLCCGESNSNGIHFKTCALLFSLFSQRNLFVFAQCKWQ